jgi:hypothetical protein
MGQHDEFSQANDGKIHRIEYGAGFEMFDNDKDGFIRKAEFEGACAPRFSFDMLDADGDGRITNEEYVKGFDMIDENRDGVITGWRCHCVRSTDCLFGVCHHNSGYNSMGACDNPRPCPAGNYSSTGRNEAGDKACRLCDSGKYASSAGLSSCVCVFACVTVCVRLKCERVLAVGSRIYTILVRSS